MRIIAGTLGGRVFSSPHGHRTHPMSDKVRGALFNALGDINGLTVLDVFAGSGALGFEAVSRGAAYVVAIDNDQAAARTISENVRELGLQKQVKSVKATVLAWLSTTEEVFDIVVCDPPYDDIQEASILGALKRVKQGGVAILSLPPNTPIAIPAWLELLQEKSYGDATLAFYRRIQ